MPTKSVGPQVTSSECEACWPKITVDEAVDIPVVTVVDQGSNKVIRQIPNEEVVASSLYGKSNFDDYSSKGGAWRALNGRS